MLLVLEGFEGAPYKRVQMARLHWGAPKYSKGESGMKPLEIKESKERRKERIQNSAFLRTRVVESKKKYNRKRDKAQMRRSMENQGKNFFKFN